MSGRNKILTAFWVLWLSASAGAWSAATADAEIQATAAPDGALWRPITGPDGAPLPFTNEQEALDFLRAATVVDRQEISGGINRPLKLLLEKDGVRMHAIFRDVDKRERQYRTHDRLVLKFHDFHAFEVAAYRLSRLLEIDGVPPAALREIDGRRGSVQVWIENARTESGRRKDGDKAPGSLEWVRQWQVMRVFDALVDNFDRNIGNILIDSRWKVWLVDHTRTFTIHRHIYQPERIHLCERGLWRRLRALDETAVQDRLGDLLNKPQQNALMKRRDMLVRYLERLMEERGEARVLFDGGR